MMDRIVKFCDFVLNPLLWIIMIGMALAMSDLALLFAAFSALMLCVRIIAYRMEKDV
jgi:Na+/citrate or Na+/malate symporter